MTPSQAVVDLVKTAEGCKLLAYLCPAGIPTIGYGHTGGVRLGDRITQQQAEVMLAFDLAKFARAVQAAVRLALTQGQFDALVSFSFNCKGWKDSTLVRLVNAGDFGGAAGEFPKWVHGDGKVLPGLVKRRAAELQLFLQA